LVAGKLDKNIIAPLQYDGSMDSALFELWFEECFIPNIPPSSTIVMDNASFRRKSKLYPFTQKHGHRIIFLPPYSPNLNEIENFWAWLKGKLKKVVHMFDDFDEALCCCFGVVWVYLSANKNCPQKISRRLYNGDKYRFDGGLFFEALMQCGFEPGYNQDTELIKRTVNNIFGDPAEQMALEHGYNLLP